MASLPECEVSQQFYFERLVTASGRSKNLRCCECRLPIERGEKYYRCTGKWDGYLWSGAQHLFCWTFARSLNGVDALGLYFRYDGTMELVSHAGRNPWGFNDGYGGCVPFEGVREMLGECGDYLSEGLHHDPSAFWNGLISGCREKFECGTGI